MAEEQKKSNGGGNEAAKAVPGSAPVGGGPVLQTGAQPSMRILAQYLKDLSFENPNAPQSLAGQQPQPDINISVNVNARNLAPNDFEVEIHLDAKAMATEQVIFAAEILYAV